MNHYEGISGLSALLTELESADYKTGMLPEMRRILTNLAQYAIQVGRIVNDIERDRQEIGSFIDRQEYGTASGHAYASLLIHRDNLKECASDLVGRVRLDDESQPDGPVADSNEGYILKEGEQ